MQERLQEAGLPDPVTEHDYNLPPPKRSRLVFLAGLAVGADAALDLLWPGKGKDDWALPAN